MPSFATHPNGTEAMEKRKFLNSIQERRTEAGKLVAGVAAVCNSENFKAPVRGMTRSYKLVLTRKKASSKPNAKCWDCKDLTWAPRIIFWFVFNR
jgi:aromatic amino acid aminotransferase I